MHLTPVPAERAPVVRPGLAPRPRTAGYRATSPVAGRAAWRAAGGSVTR